MSGELRSFKIKLLRGSWGEGVGEPVMTLPGSLRIPEEAEDCKFNVTVIVSTMGFSPAAAPSSPRAVMELMRVGQKVGGGGVAKVKRHQIRRQIPRSRMA